MIAAVNESLRFILQCIGEFIRRVVVNANGKYYVLPLFILGIVISVIFLAVKLIKGISWGN